MVSAVPNKNMHDSGYCVWAKAATKRDVPIKALYHNYRLACDCVYETHRLQPLPHYSGIVPTHQNCSEGSVHEY